MALFGNVVRAGAFLEHPVRTVRVVLVARFGVSASDAEASAFLDLPVVVRAGETRVARLAGI